MGHSSIKELLGIVKLTILLALQFLRTSPNDQMQLVLSGLDNLITDEVRESVVIIGMYCVLHCIFRHFQAIYVLALGQKVGIFWHCRPYFVSFLPFCLYCFLLVHQGSSVVIHRSYPIPRVAKEYPQVLPSTPLPHNNGTFANLTDIAAGNCQSTRILKLIAKEKCVQIITSQ